ncbi:MAG: glutamine-hydrolyzing GMP synthase [Candidatus Omnitrophica bacterium]|nr:glutamine-hydrolyzing GMP synthase [Candidatus Omnitrophota bacterium]MDD5042363.1 glutamine-hydrolyzing GMP synthase [Candidatus Omnitrophota bacterium]MDD5500651.1 glutamine-hydrolyzing GMP synthase [Candidatus Omnitrophota bacterium]
MTRQTILILDFGSQYTQLIARRVRENKVFSRIIPYNTPAKEIAAMNPKGLIFSGGPASVVDKKSPYPDKNIFKLGIPILGICYGMQVICEMLGGKVKHTREREFGRAELFIDDNRDLFSRMPGNFTCWASHGDFVTKMPQGFHGSAHTANSPIAAISNQKRKIFAVQFHPEVTHTEKGNQILSNFLFKICGALSRWNMQSFIKESIEGVKKMVGKDKVVLGLSGGVDSSVAALLIHKAINRNLRCIFINNGLLRKGEAEQVKSVFKDMYHLNLTYVDRSRRFLERLKGVTDPEEKRKIIGDEFVKVFEEEAKKTKGAKYLGQGTLYPDVIESVSPSGGPSRKIKSHHNVGGLPAKMSLKLVEPLREIFKDEAREIGRQLNLPENIIQRQPFPGPGLAVRIIGEVTEERLNLLREADKRVLEEIIRAGLYGEIWQSFAVLLPVKSVGIMGDERTYENAVAVRCVSSFDGMTADWVKLPYEVMDRISNRIINEVKGINRVVYDISSKPPATIEWE